MNTFLPIADYISATTGKAFTLKAVQPVQGGDINASFCLQGATDSYFVKRTNRHWIDMFSAEYAGLQALAVTKTIRVPEPIGFGQTETHAFLVLPFIAFGHASKQSDRALGQQLAQLHHIAQPHFGWERNNTIGSTAQINTPCEQWVTFWREYRLGFQLTLAAKNGYGGKLQASGEQLLADLDLLFACYYPKPSLLHGDLWGGNVAVDQQGNPLIFDPACYYGDREADLAMTELFGGFTPDFYAAYQSIWPLDRGYATRKSLYNLYHVLNHLNLFGGGYLSQAETLLTRILAEIR